MYYTQTSALYMRACHSGPVPVRYRPGGSRISSGALKMGMGIKNESNDYQISQVAHLTYPLLGGVICAGGKLALTNISTRSTFTEGRELSWCRLCRRWWHCRLSLGRPALPRVAAEWHHGDSLFSSVLIIYWEYIACSFVNYMAIYRKV